MNRFASLYRLSLIENSTSYGIGGAPCSTHSNDAKFVVTPHLTVDDDCPAKFAGRFFARSFFDGLDKCLQRDFVFIIRALGFLFHAFDKIALCRYRQFFKRIGDGADQKIQMLAIVTQIVDAFIFHKKIFTHSGITTHYYQVVIG